MEVGDLIQRTHKVHLGSIVSPEKEYGVIVRVLKEDYGPSPRYEIYWSESKETEIFTLHALPGKKLQ